MNKLTRTIATGVAGVIAAPALALGAAQSASAATINHSPCAVDLMFSHRAGAGYTVNVGTWCPQGYTAVVQIKQNGVTAATGVGPWNMLDGSLWTFTPIRGANYQIVETFYSGAVAVGYATSGAPQVLAN
jgi:hypothetical protein